MLMVLLCFSIDRTYKMYYGGAQKRPDSQYSRPVINPSGKVVGHVGEGNRKDVRNAVEAAHGAAAGWGEVHICYCVLEMGLIKLLR